MTRINLLCIGSYDKWFCIKHDKSLQIYFICVKRQAKNDFLKAVESIAVHLKTPIDNLQYHRLHSDYSR